MRGKIFIVLWGLSASVYADSSVRESAGASVHASRSVLHGLAVSGQVTLGVSAAPLAIGASALLVGGAVAGASARATANQPNAAVPVGTPLPITNEVITLTPPNVALQADNAARKP